MTAGELPVDGFPASGLPVGDLPAHGRCTTDLDPPEQALAIGAHPDDVELGCGGTLAKWAAHGTSVHILVLTDGSKGTWDRDADVQQLVALRRSEQCAAARTLARAEVTFLDYVDGELVAGLEERRRVCRVIRSVRPDVILGHDPWRRYRLHPDHRAAGWLTVDALVAARDGRFHPECGDAHRPHTLLLFEPDEPDHVEDVGSTLDDKARALTVHRSQFRSTFSIDPEADEESAARILRRALGRQAAQHGALIGLDAGEAFHALREPAAPDQHR